MGKPTTIEEKLDAAAKKTQKKLLAKTIERAMDEEMDKMAYIMTKKYLKTHQAELEKAVMKEISRRLPIMARQAAAWYLESR